MVSGVDLRFQKREQRKAQAIELVEEHFKQYFPDPSSAPTQAEFSKKSMQMLDKIEQALNSADLVYLAIRHFNKLVIEHQKHHHWDVSPIVHHVTHREPTQLMNKKWKARAWHVNQLFHQMHNLLEKGQGVTTEKEVHRMLILSLIFHSGQHQSIVVKAFNELIYNLNIKIHTLFGRVFITLHLDEPRLNTNARIQVGNNVESVLEYHCFLHPITVGLLRKWLGFRSIDWPGYPIEQRDIFHHLLEPFDITHSSTSSLKRFCQAASMCTRLHVSSQVSQALVCVQAGLTDTYGLPFQNLHRLMHPDTNAIPSIQFDDFIYPKICFQSNERTRKPIDIQFMRKLKTALSMTKQSNAKVSKSGVKDALTDMLKNHELSEPQTLLVQWLVHKCRTCEPSTLRQYALSMSRVWLSAVVQLELLEASSDDILEAYESLLEKNYELKRRSFIAGRLVDLHNFVVKHNPGIAPIPYQALFSGHSVRSHTRSGFVDEALFCALLTSIDGITDLNSSEKLAMQVVCLLMYRGGLRLNEIKKLQLNEIETMGDTLSDAGWITVKNNKWGKNKTLSSLRKIPLTQTLRHSEKPLVNKYLLHRRQLPHVQDRLFIVIGASRTVFDSSAVSNCISTILRRLTGLSFFVTYHLRHSCLSRLQLLIELNEQQLDPLPNICAYTPTERQNLKKAIFGLNQQFPYYELAAFAGHESPEVTFQHYLHFSDFIMSDKWKKETLPLTLKMAMACQLTSRRQFKQIQTAQGAVYPFDLADYNIKKIKIREIQTHIKANQQVKIPLLSKDTISVEMCFWLVQLYSQGEDIQALVLKYGISSTIIKKWITNATYLANMKTKTVFARSRHIAEYREPQILPGKLKNVEEQKLAEKFFRRLKVLPPKKRQIILKHLNHIVINTSVSKSGILFSKPHLLSQFIQDMSFVFPKRSWRANTLHIEFSSKEKEWQQALKEIKTVTEKAGTKNGRQGIGSARVEFISPNEKQYIANREDISKMSSHLLHYIAYMVIVMMRSSK
ncbi:site-specific integrase [Vibrio rumoiensis]|uniref:site-specific integrase n=1 Tax=Vibrio rumoiensis TaxID=76258 RepID=UPI000B5C2A74|nr:site-specific integrase [Vibrio rumoiensis]